MERESNCRAMVAALLAVVCAVAMPHAVNAQYFREEQIGPREQELSRGGANQCWTPDELAARPGEERIEKGTARAYRDIPGHETLKSHSRFSRRGKVLRRVNLPPGEKLIAFTFDLCEQPYEITGYQGGIVDFLRKNKVPATFFAGGKWMLTHANRAQQILADPLFEIGNHAWEHRNFQILSPQQMATEIGGTQLAYSETYKRLEQRHCVARNGRLAHKNAQPLPELFRFPFGACNPEAIRQVEDFGLHAIQWDVSSADPWTGQTAEKMVASVKKHAKPGSIVLFHANGRGWHTGEALKTLIRDFRERGFTFVKVSDLMARGEPVYASSCYDSRPNDVDRYQSTARKLERAYDAFYARHGKKRGVLRSAVSFDSGPEPYSTRAQQPSSEDEPIDTKAMSEPRPIPPVPVPARRDPSGWGSTSVNRFD